ncbi:MAG: Deoxyuridine 5'-triphosphate nucleotidohydrolase [Sarea resinae]|nr:MAG: Deoxyuridine 5'-triphosphate nucleotidohydrolase [Sarea resinae]
MPSARLATTPPPPAPTPPVTTASAHPPPSLPNSPLPKRPKTNPTPPPSRLTNPTHPDPLAPDLMAAQSAAAEPEPQSASSKPQGHEPAVTKLDAAPPLLVKKLNERARAPTRGSAFAAGYDLYSQIQGTQKLTLPSLLKDGRVAPRSGLASKHHLDVGAGVIDADYRGEVKVLLFNFSGADFAVRQGDRVAQLVLERIYTPAVVEVQELEASVRGTGGFGSTG